MSVSEDELNAFIDNELNAADRARVLEAISRDEALQKRVAEIQQARELLRHAYARPPQPARRAATAPAWTRQMLAASVLLSVGIVTGWLLHSLAGRASLPAAGTAAMPKGVVIQVSEADPAKWAMALLNARNVRKAYGDKPIAVEIVAYGPGLKMLQTNSPVTAGLEEASSQGIKLKACNNSMNLLGTTREDLNHAVEVVPAGVVEIMERQREGYAYVRP